MRSLKPYIIIALLIIGCGNQENTDNNEKDSANTEIESTNTISYEETNETTEAETTEKTTEESEQNASGGYFITNEGIAGLKLGMTLDEVKSGLTNLTCEKVISEIDEIEFYRLKKGDDDICQFELDQEQTVMHISVGDNFKTDKGIGMLSTVAEVKQKYTVLPYKIVEGAEGLPFICLTIKEMPNIQMWLNYEVPEDYYMDEKKVLASVPEDSKIIDIYIEKRSE
jgi:hypothetical protein